MISSVTKQIKGETHTFCLSSRAMMALEDQFDLGIIALIDKFQRDVAKNEARMGTLVKMLAECADDGEGTSIQDAQAAFNALGMMGAAKLLGQCVEKAFPEAAEKKEAPTKNRKRAPQRK